MNDMLDMLNETIELMTYNSGLIRINGRNEVALDFEAGNNGWYRVRVETVSHDRYDVWLEKFEWRFSKTPYHSRFLYGSFWIFSKTPCHGRCFVGITGQELYNIVVGLFHAV